MKNRTSVTFILAAWTVAGLAIADAAPSGCAVATTGYPGTPFSCEFVATGPTDYVAASASGWTILRWDEEHSRWVRIAGSGPETVRPTAVSVKTGTLPTEPGDRLHLSISSHYLSEVFWALPQTYYQDGFIAAFSDAE